MTFKQYSFLISTHKLKKKFNEILAEKFFLDAFVCVKFFVRIF